MKDDNSKESVYKPTGGEDRGNTEEGEQMASMAWQRVP